MQFGVDTSFLKWSPVKWRYKQWAGLYSTNNKHIYVNTGIGHLGYAGRVGIMPEITVLNLYS
jgi:predicted MPP superfamily phosphohydrolase